MSYISVPFVRDLFPELFIEISNLDKLYLALPHQLLHLSGTHGPLLQDLDFYARVIKDKYQVDKMPDMPGMLGLLGIDDSEGQFTNEKELLTALGHVVDWPLHLQNLAFVSIGSLPLVKHDVNRGADVDAWGSWSLVVASGNGHLPLVKYLLQKGADVNAGNGMALQRAVTRDHPKVVRYLLEHGADIHAEYEMALRDAIRDGASLDMVKYLVSQGADMRIFDDEPLRVASVFDRLDIVKFLVSKGANVDGHGNTRSRIIDWAAINNNADVVRYLIESGADTSVLTAKQKKRYGL